MDPSSPSPPPKDFERGGLPATVPHPLSRSTSDSVLGTVKSTTKDRTGRKTSSRTRKAWSAAPSQASSFDGSNFSMEDYSIDLAKLGEKDSSWSIGKAGERDIEHVSSRDEGPEDFTLRLGEWMRGTMPWKQYEETKNNASRGSGQLYEEEEGESQHENGRSPEHGEVDAELDEGKHRWTACKEDEQSELLPLRTSTPAPGLGQRQDSGPPAPPLSRLNTEAMQDQAAREVFDQISALQAEVERLRLENREYQSAQRAVEHANLQQQKECRVLKTQVDDLRSEARRLQDSEFKASQKALRLEQESKRDVSKVGSLRAKFEPLTQELDTVKLRAEADKQCADSTINALKSDLKAAKDHAAKVQADLTMALSTNAAEVEAIKAEIEACRTKSQHREDVLKEQLQDKDLIIDSLKDEKAKAEASVSPELAQAQEQLTETRRLVQNVEDENELLVQESERQAEDISNLQQALKEERLQRLSSSDAQVAELQDEIARMQAQKTTDTMPYSEHRAAVDQLQIDHTAATETLTAKHKKELNVLRAAIIKAGEGMKKREERLAASHEQQTSDLMKQIKRLEEASKNVPIKKSQRAEDDSPTVVELRSAISTLNSRLVSTRQTLQETSTENEQLRQEESQAHRLLDKAKEYTAILKQEADKQIKAVKKENEEINREMDKRTEKMMEEREREWRRRIKIMFKEREVMAKALMAAWGREECGEAEGGGKQRYRYKYVDKEGKLLA
ncbi:MAG: hypothetical protein Q9201_004689 [Fulgogasparrea decipioides]